MANSSTKPNTVESEKSHMKSFSKKKKVLRQCNYGAFSNCSLTWNIRWSNLSMLGLFYSDYTRALSGTRFWLRFLHSPKMNLGYDSSSVLFFDFFFPFVLLEQGKKNPTCAKYGGWGGGGGAGWLHSLITFSYISTGTLCGKEGDCILSGNVVTWGWWLSETSAYLVSQSGNLFCFCRLHLSPCIDCLWGIFLKVSSAFAHVSSFLGQQEVHTNLWTPLWMEKMYRWCSEREEK